LGRKRVVVGAMLGVALGTALAATAQSLPQLIGGGSSRECSPGIAAVIMAYISEEAPPAAWAARWRRM